MMIKRVITLVIAALFFVSVGAPGVALAKSKVTDKSVSSATTHKKSSSVKKKHTSSKKSKKSAKKSKKSAKAKAKKKSTKKVTKTAA